MKNKSEGNDLDEADSSAAQTDTSEILEPVTFGKLIQIERKSDVVAALSAAISIPLSVSALLIALKTYTYAPKIEFHRPSYVLFVEDQCDHFNDDRKVVVSPCIIVVAAMVYSNFGDPGHNDVILNETIKIKIPREIEFVLGASDYVITNNPTSKRNSHLRTSYPHSNEQRNRLSWTVVSESYPVVVNTSDVESHETLFGWNKTSLISPDIVFGESNRSKVINVTFEVQTKKSGLIKEVCTVKAKEFRFNELDQWASVDCAYKDK